MNTLAVRPALIRPEFYESNCDRAVQQFQNSEFWKSIITAIANVNSQYIIDNGDILVANLSPQIVIKPHKSFIEKTFRKNVLNNQNWPESPDDGWITPENWFSRIGDIIRTTIVVRYIDGVGYISRSVDEIIRNLDVTCSQEFEGRMDGYYALHLCYEQDIKLINEDWSGRDVLMKMELQITTEVKQLVKSLLHVFYEKQRISPSSVKEDWVWDYTSDKFSASNLGHMLHYIEGMLVTIRNRQA